MNIALIAGLHRRPADRRHRRHRRPRPPPPPADAATASAAKLPRPPPTDRFSCRGCVRLAVDLLAAVDAVRQALTACGSSPPPGRPRHAARAGRCAHLAAPGLAPAAAARRSAGRRRVARRPCELAAELLALLRRPARRLVVAFALGRGRGRARPCDAPGSCCHCRRRRYWLASKLLALIVGRAVDVDVGVAVARRRPAPVPAAEHRRARRRRPGRTSCRSPAPRRSWAAADNRPADRRDRARPVGPVRIVVRHVDRLRDWPAR